MDTGQEEALVKVLFICTGCINRSATAHVILATLGKDKHEVQSCGTGKVAPLGCRIPRKMRDVLTEMGYDPAHHRSQGINLELLSWADKIICMGNVHEKFIKKHFPEMHNKVENWRIKDPHFAKGDALHRTVAKEIEQCVKTQFL